MSDQEFTTQQAAKEYGVNKQTIYDWRDKYGIGTQKYGVWVFTRAELDYANDQAQSAQGGRPRKSGGWFGRK